MIYLCGPMTDIPNFNKDKFNAVAAKLRAMGAAVYDPAEDFKENRTAAMCVDIPRLIHCTEVVVIDGWKDSWGATLEARIAWETGKPIYDEDYHILPKDTGRFELMERDLVEKFPFGHPAFRKLSLEEMQLHSDKNHDYASGGNPLGNFQRVAQIKSMYTGFPDATPVGVALTYLLKQLDAVMWGLAKGIKHRVEGYGPRLQDVSVYARLARIMIEEK
jgi:hypothetical protein